MSLLTKLRVWWYLYGASQGTHCPFCRRKLEVNFWVKIKNCPFIQCTYNKKEMGGTNYKTLVRWANDIKRNTVFQDTGNNSNRLHETRGGKRRMDSLCKRKKDMHQGTEKF